MSEQPDRARFRRPPERVRPEDVVETVDTESLPLPDGSEERDRLLREAGGV